MSDTRTTSGWATFETSRDGAYLSASIELRELVEDYLAVCNRVLVENEDRFLFRQAKQLNRVLWGEANFRAIVFEGDPDRLLGEFVIRFDPEQRKLRLVEIEADEEVAFSWKVSRRYLEDVARLRPEWYIEHPSMLDLNWATDRARTEVERRFGEGTGPGAAAAVLVLGMVVGVLIARSVRR